MNATPARRAGAVALTLEAPVTFTPPRTPMARMAPFAMVCFIASLAPAGGNPTWAGEGELASPGASVAGEGAAVQAERPRPPAVGPRESAADLADSGEAERLAVWQAEEGFAAAFAARDPERFAAFIADEAVFAGANTLLRGKAAVREAWTRMMLDGPAAPFSWRPTRVLVTGDVALSSGPVLDPAGNWVGGFTSVWRRQADGAWKVALDGAAPCQAPTTGS
jgi:ketosteroid isomerase-like protein